MTLLLLTALAAASGPSSPAAAVVARAAVAASAADSTVILWTFDLAPGWHLYGPHRNDTGQPPTVSLTAPPDWSAGPLVGWPRPQRHVVADLILDHIYEDRLELWQTIRHPAGAAPQTVPALARWLVCGDICVPGDTTLALVLPGPPDPAAAARLAVLRQERPQPLPPSVYTARAIPDGFAVTVPGARGLTFIPDAAGPALVDLLHDGVTAGPTLVLRLAPGWREPLTGLLCVDYKDHQRVGMISLTPPNQGDRP
ncbi:MAG: protein-disulfide reductase DsbD family protein [Candidatus Krumholzibacteriia bacterium]